MSLHETDHKIGYFPEIDGLRALSVLAVILFHLGAPWLPGGFIGVDVFFVISGYLIGLNIQRELKDGTFRFPAFFKRRIARIFPALALVILVTELFVLAGTRLTDAVTVTQSGLWASLGGSNWFFNQTAGDYFASTVDKMHLLHTWSLGVEEQFYLLCPILLYCIHKRQLSAKSTGLVLFALSLVSLVTSQILVKNASPLAFYSLQSRAWELLLGILLTLTPKAFSPTARACFGWVGIPALFTGFLSLGSSTPFPGMSCLLPTLSSCLIILGNDRGINTLLSLKPFTFIGKISYSLYLWHWPITLSLATLLPKGSAAHNLSSLAATFISGYLSWRFVETPLRKWHITHPQLLVTAFVSLLASSALLASHVKRHHGFLVPQSKQVEQIFQTAQQGTPFQRQSFDKHVPPEKSFTFGDTSKIPRFVLWGDSHANSIAVSFAESAANHQVSVKFYGRGGTAPIPKWHTQMEGKRKNELVKKHYTEAAYTYISENDNIHTVVLSARWTSYVRNDSVLDMSLINNPNTPQEIHRKANILFNTLNELIDLLNAQQKKVVLLYPIPEIGHHVPEIVALQFLDPTLHLKIPSYTDCLRHQSAVFDAFDRLPQRPGLVRLQPHKFLVENDQILISQDNTAYYSDSNHLNVHGARRLKPLFDSIINGNAVDDPHAPR